MERFELYSEVTLRFVDRTPANIYHWKAPYYRELETEPEESFFNGGDEIIVIIKEIRGNEILVQLEDGGMVWLDGNIVIVI